jgi:hypothetical protein
MRTSLGVKIKQDNIFIKSGWNPPGYKKEICSSNNAANKKGSFPTVNVKNAFLDHFFFLDGKNLDCRKNYYYIFFYKS